MIHDYRRIEITHLKLGVKWSEFVETENFSHTFNIQTNKPLRLN